MGWVGPRLGGELGAMCGWVRVEVSVWAKGCWMSDAPRASRSAREHPSVSRIGQEQPGPLRSSFVQRGDTRRSQLKTKPSYFMYPS